MSYINDALHKVQKEKESPYAPYGNIISAEGKKHDKWETWFSVIGLSIVFFFAAGIITLLYWPDVRKASSVVTVVQRPGDVTVHPRLDDAIGNMPPAKALETAVVRPEVLAGVVAPIPAKVEKSPQAGKVSPAKVEEKKQNVVMLNKRIKQESQPKPAQAVRGNLYAKALQKQREGKLMEAKELYREVIKQEPRNIRALNNLGVVYLKMKRYKWAIIRLNDALNIKHNYVDAHYNLACLYAQKNDTKQSLFYLKNAIDFNPEVRQWAADDDDLKVLANLPEFDQLMQVRDN